MISNESFLNNDELTFLNEAKEKKLILFGASLQMRDALERFLKPNKIEVAYAVDNDYHIWYSRVYGIDVYEPRRLNDEDCDNTVILITSRFPYRIEDQLKRYGIKKYYSWHLFLEEHIGRYQFIVFF